MEASPLICKSGARWHAGRMCPAGPARTPNSASSTASGTASGSVSTAGPISAAMIARSRTLAEPRWSPSGRLVGWLDGFDGRIDVMIAPTDGIRPPWVVTADTPVTPVGGYGGGGWAWVSDEEIVVATADGRLVRLRADGGGVLAVLSRDGNASAPAVAPDGSAVAFTLERDDTSDIAVVPLDATQWPVRLSHADFAWDAAWSPDSTTLAWHEWDLPDMPWSGSRVAMATLGPALVAGPTRVVAGGDGVAVGQPRWSPDGSRVAFVSDRGGTPNVVVARADGTRAVALRAEPHEHAPPAWGPGLRTFAWSPDSASIAFTRNEHGFGRLVRAARRGRSTTNLAKAFHHGLDWSANGIVAVRSGAVSPPQVVVTDAASRTRRVLARGAVAGFEARALVEPTPVRWRSGTATVHGLLYRPAAASGKRGSLPPMLVTVHGGPTDQSQADWNPRIAFWVSRGWTVLSVNYRGSTGYGRAYREALDGYWGTRDVADVAAGIRHAAREHWCDPRRVAITGGSAGGFTVLLVCALHANLVAAGVSLFGVTDLLGLAATTHRFESRYLDRLVGALPRHADRYRDRSPITHAASITVPMLVLQGRDDKVVPIAQADAMVAAMRAAGAEVDYHVYEGEGHGFRRLASIVDEYARTEAFLTHHVLKAF